MLALSDRSIEAALQFFTSRGIQVGLIVPTRTGLKKSIMDAHSSLRAFLRDADIHDFAKQGTGQANKVMVQATVLGAYATTQTSISLYRPDTKQGDPRIWISGLSKWAGPGNLIALLAVGNRCYVVNLSDRDVWEAREDPDSPLGEVLSEFVSDEERAASELVGKITALARRGWIRSGRLGDTGVGYTLESALGIRANSSRAPDYRGIELKSARDRSGRTTLFSQVPDWKSSAIGSARDLLERFGYTGASGRLQLYCTAHAQPNPLGLFLQTSEDYVHCLASDGRSTNRVIQWLLPDLEDSLAKKHNSTFWVKADVCRGAAGVEYFHYRSITHTRAAIASNLGALIDGGKVTLDLTLSEKPHGQVRDHGYLFRMAPAHHPLLFPPPITYELAPKLAPLH